MDIIPVTHCNIGRFINGSTKKREANVKSRKCLVGKEFTILLYSSRKIKREEIEQDDSGDSEIQTIYGDLVTFIMMLFVNFN